MIRVLDPNPPHLGQSPKEENEISPKKNMSTTKDHLFKSELNHIDK